MSQCVRWCLRTDPFKHVKQECEERECIRIFFFFLISSDTLSWFPGVCVDRLEERKTRESETNNWRVRNKQRVKRLAVRKKNKTITESKEGEAKKKRKRTRREETRQQEQREPPFEFGHAFVCMRAEFASIIQALCVAACCSVVRCVAVCC